MNHESDLHSQTSEKYLESSIRFSAVRHSYKDSNKKNIILSRKKVKNVVDLSKCSSSTSSTIHSISFQTLKLKYNHNASFLQ